MRSSYTVDEITESLTIKYGGISGPQHRPGQQTRKPRRSQVAENILNCPPPETEDEIAKTREMLDAIPADCEYTFWLMLVWAVISTGWSCAEQLIREWSMTAPERFDEEGLQKAIKTFDPCGGIHYGTLVYHAKQHGWEESKDILNEISKVLDKKQTGYTLTHISQLLKEPVPMDWLIYGVVPPDSIIFINGPPASGKSLTALDMAMNIAIGKDWHGRRVKQGSGIIIAGEGHSGIRRRLKAWEIHNNIDISKASLSVSDAGANFADPASVQDVMAAIDDFAKQHGNPVLIIIDTLHRNFVGDENSAQDMGNYVHHIDLLRNRYRCSVMTVHHTGHKAQERARGSSSILAAADTEFIVKPQGERELVVDCTKMKDGPKPDTAAFEIIQVELPWLDTLGCHETSVTIKPISLSKSEKIRQLSDSIRLGIGSLHFAIRAKGGINGKTDSAAHLEDWRKQFYSDYKADTTKAKNQAFNRARRELVASKIVIEKDDQYVLTNGSESPWTGVVELIKSLNGGVIDETR